MKHSWIVSRNCVHHLSCNACYLIGPAEPPQNVTATALSSTEIEVSWEEVPAIDQNGIIIMYQVQYEPLETFEDQISTINTTMLTTTLTDLDEYVEYSITVRAYTSVGPGPYSDPPITEITEEDCMKVKLMCHNHYVYFNSTCFATTKCLSG